MKVFVVVLVVVTLFGAVAHSLPHLSISGFTWAENLSFGRKHLFVSDSGTGILWRVELNAAKDAYTRFKHQSTAFTHINGLAALGGDVYACVELKSNGSALVRIDASYDGDAGKAPFDVVAPTPNMGNGLAFDAAHEKFFFTSEANLARPKRGFVYSVSMHGGDVVVESKDEPPQADGCRVDASRRLLYVSDVTAAKVSVFNIDEASGALALNRTFRAPLMKMLDDFALDASGTLLFGADFQAGNVVQFAADGSTSPLAPRIVATDLLQPTSVQFGVAPNFNSSYIYITEGGGVPLVNHNRRVLQSDFAV
jgi:sugar lactone lactonase YvrE